MLAKEQQPFITRDCEVVYKKKKKEDCPWYFFLKVRRERGGKTLRSAKGLPFSYLKTSL